MECSRAVSEKGPATPTPRGPHAEGKPKAAISASTSSEALEGRKRAKLLCPSLLQSGCDRVPVTMGREGALVPAVPPPQTACAFGGLHSSSKGPLPQLLKEKVTLNASRQRNKYYSALKSDELSTTTRHEGAEMPLAACRVIPATRRSGSGRTTGTVGRKTSGCRGRGEGCAGRARGFRTAKTPVAHARGDARHDILVSTINGATPRESPTRNRGPWATMMGQWRFIRWDSERPVGVSTVGEAVWGYRGHTGAFCTFPAISP